MYPMVGRFFAAALSSSLLAGCGGSDQLLTQPPPVGTADFVLTIAAMPEDAATAQALGWTGGIPGAEVVVTPADSTGSARTLTTSASGSVSIPGLAAGKYAVSARRLFSAAELQRLGAASNAQAYVGLDSISASTSTRSATVAIPVSIRRPLVISEWAFTLYFEAGTLGSYLSGGFLELYNNSDTTVFLDGMVIASGLYQGTDFPGFSCALLEPFRNDPAGIWTQQLAAFPGTGRQYALAPGGAVVVATDAIDHRQFSNNLLDLRSANFEFIGGADVDNPSVPNMIDYSLREPLGGHGLYFPSSLGTVALVVAPVTPGVLTRGKLPPNANEYFRMPREGIHDVLVAPSTFILSQGSVCPQQVNAAIDRKEGYLLRDDRRDFAVSLSRKMLTTLPNGRVVLQHTRTSANDYKRTPRTPGVVQ